MAALLAYFLFSVICLSPCKARDTITPARGLKDDGETIVSEGGKFALGFLSPNRSRNRYVGIWYTSESERPVPVIWVANKETPLTDSNSGLVSINDTGSLVVTDGRDQNPPLWSTAGQSALSNSSARLLDTGNLVLINTDTGETMWESFDHPDHAFLVKMKVGINVNTNQSRFMKSWKDPSDPSAGKYSLGISPIKPYQILIWSNSEIHWRSGPWNSRAFLGVPWMGSFYLNGFSITAEGGTIDFKADFFDDSDSNQTVFLLNSMGSLERLTWAIDSKEWLSSGAVPMSECDVYGKCGPWGLCNSFQSPSCTCFIGFEPRFGEEWSRENWSGGCVRRGPLSCEANGSRAAEKKEDGFLKLPNVKPPDSIASLSFRNAEECEGLCLNNCSCVAYAFDAGIGCMFWNGELMDLQKFSADGIDLYLRVPASEIVAGEKKHLKVIIVTVVVLGTTSVCVFVFLLWRWIAKHGEPGQSSGGKLKGLKRLLGNQAVSSVTDSLPTNLKQEGPELPMFDCKVVSLATDDFSLANKLGAGGFGPVYKGRLPGGQEVAVKRLSRSSGQGLREFINEVLVISRVQHKNLVRLLGYCAQGEEKMLLYEYMPNKSLDSFIFDSDERRLDWAQRFHVVEGIARGLLYLHRDSRLKIIHRDLKASNILLDKELNPKISDFGLARIFGGNQIQDETRRVVGTYGYMSPEYAMEGRFSEKSDIFSFGVLLLEIVSGKKNTSFYDEEESLNLLSLAWRRWNDGQALELIDPLLGSTYSEAQVMRCIHVGLLCVQEFAADRPSTSALTMHLGSDTTIPPNPKQPAFTATTSRKSASPNEQDSGNDITVTSLEGR